MTAQGDNLEGATGVLRYNSNTNEIRYDTTSMTPTGAVMSYLGTSDPSGWVICDGEGRTTQYEQYNSLVNMSIGYYSTSTGTTTYHPPDYKSAFMRGIGSRTVDGVGYSTSGDLGSPQAHQSEQHHHLYTNNYFTEGSDTWSGGGDAGGGYVGTSGSLSSATEPYGTNMQACPMHVLCNWIVKI